MIDKERIAQLEKAIRDHRATKTPAAWSDADKRLYDFLPELHEPNSYDRRMESNRKQ